MSNGSKMLVFEIDVCLFVLAVLLSFRSSGNSRHGSVVNESDYEPEGFRFDPWPCSVG